MLDPTSELGKERILSTEVRPKKENKGLLDKYLINAPPKDISAAVKWAATNVCYPLYRAIPIDCENNHLLQIGETCALALSCYLEMHIQNIGCWMGETVKEYICVELLCFSDGMEAHVTTRG